MSPRSRWMVGRGIRHNSRPELLPGMTSGESGLRNDVGFQPGGLLSEEICVAARDESVRQKRPRFLDEVHDSHVVDRRYRIQRTCDVGNLPLIFLRRQSQ